jgi:hypothetical protein
MSPVSMVAVSIFMVEEVVLELPDSQKIPAATIASISSVIFSFPDIPLLIDSAEEVDYKSG